MILVVWLKVSSGCESIELSAPQSQTQEITFSGDNGSTVRYTYILYYIEKVKISNFKKNKKDIIPAKGCKHYDNRTTLHFEISHFYFREKMSRPVFMHEHSYEWGSDII